MRARLLASLFVLVTSSACIEDTLSVDIATQVFPDGTCTRRVVYRLERKGAADESASILPENDPLRIFHRFPSGEGWTVKDEVRATTHVVDVDGRLSSPDAIEGDYARSLSKRGVPAARNFVSFARSGEEPEVEYAYAETFRDPASPLEGMRALSAALAKRDEWFAERLLRALGSSPLQKDEVRRAYRATFAEPFARGVGRVAERPIWGPRERAELERLGAQVDELQKALLADLVLRAPSVPESAMSAALDKVQDEMGGEILPGLERAGLLLTDDNGTSRIHFRATLTLPGTIVRANTCVQGDTATWEFDQADLYGGGFEMWAKAVGR